MESDKEWKENMNEKHKIRGIVEFVGLLIIEIRNLQNRRTNFIVNKVLGSINFR